MAQSESDILETLRRLCGTEPRAVSVAEIARESGYSARTVKRALVQFVESGRIIKTGREREINVISVVTIDARFATLSPDERRQLGREDDGIPGDEYTPILDVEAARADRARLMADKSWRPRPTWARGSK